MESLSQSFRALGDYTRLRILRLLATAPLNVSELVSLVGVAQSSVSHHLGKLRGLDLIKEERQAGFTYYSLAVEPTDPRWALVKLAQDAEDPEGDLARLSDLLRRREDRQALNEKLLEPGQSWFLWAQALGALLPPLTVADFGCGTGLLTVEIARFAKKVLGIDASADVLDKARDRVGREGLTNVDLLQQDLHALTLKDARVDVVVVSQSLHHVEDPARVISEAHRILVPGGRVLVMELMPHEEKWVSERLGHRHLGFDPDAIRAQLSEAGFKRLRLTTQGRGGGSPFRVFLLAGEKPR
jgi:ubiquinone/menaquinone biosynthesis C-methylase UbiE/DNA-binding transcriptional ArsR family regulator